MLKKWFGSLTFLTFAFGVIAPILIVLKPAEADHNVRWIRPLTVHYVCAGDGGNILYTEYTDRRWTESINHPPKTWQTTRPGAIALLHTAHGIENRYLVSGETEYRTLWKEDDWRCR